MTVNYHPSLRTESDWELKGQSGKGPLEGWPQRRQVRQVQNESSSFLASVLPAAPGDRLQPCAAVRTVHVSFSDAVYFPQTKA